MSGLRSLASALRTHLPAVSRGESRELVPLTGMDYKATPQMHQATRVLVEEVMRTGFFLIDVLSGLVEDLEDNDALRGEDPAEVVLAMVAGSFVPACNAAGPDVVESAAALVGALADRTIEDLRTAAEMSERAA